MWSWLGTHGPTLVAIIGGMVEIARRQRKLRKEVLEIHVLVNSRLTELLDVSKRASHLEGAAEQRAKDK